MSTLIRWLHRIEDAVLITLLLAMVLLAGIDIFARTLFGGGIGWIPPLLRVMVLWLGLLGALLATRTREHIAIDLINRLGAAWLQRLSRVVTSLFAAAVCAIIAWHSQEYVQLAYEYGDQAFARLPAWPMQLVIPFSFAVMALRFLVQAGQSLRHAEETA
ncbi:hypothetical protein GCM10011297_26020 [Bacterioplanes sanyensis]|uniref:TRAP transporter small permease n=1 Tax=Bacterioplanes sanyensis TaxID=1249553 RepID=UPI00167ABF73|nr:TRAP transporter small permease [Bacterioplanes sanyensis]GGY52010.1 hypothetical protein GCM10011297_26020 [Bacterioplanes sanyensis]